MADRQAQGENANILDDDVLQVIMDYERELFTDVGGAELNYNNEKRPSPWNEDWCLMSYPQLPMGSPKCASGVGPAHMFSMNADGRAATKQQILDGHSFLGGGALACMCGDSDTCTICNEDGTVKGLAGVNPMTLMSNFSAALAVLSQWPTSVSTCILNFATNLENTMATMTTTTTTTTTTTSVDPFLATCAADASRGPAMDLSNTQAYLGGVFAMVTAQCASGNSCMLSPPGTSAVCASSAYYPATDATGLVNAEEKSKILENLCNPSLPLWFNAKNTFLPTSFDCEAKTSKYALSRFFAGHPWRHFRRHKAFAETFLS